MDDIEKYRYLAGVLRNRAEYPRLQADRPAMLAMAIHLERCAERLERGEPVTGIISGTKSSENKLGARA